jgi:uncharacterized protein
MAALAVVALSARILAEAAARDGYRVFSADVFGDQDTRRASVAWQCAAAHGPADPLQIHTPTVLAWLQGLAARGDVAAWIAGGGCEGLPDLLHEGAKLLPLLGMPAAAVLRVRDPRVFFGVLDRHHIAHPEVRFTPPTQPQGWLRKDASACGGRHIESLDVLSQALDVPNAQGRTGPSWSPTVYFQRQMPGVPMSVGFCADAKQAHVMGYHELLTQGTINSINSINSINTPNAAQRFTHAGVIGPVALPPRAAQALTRALPLLCQDLGLQGLCSLDFLLQGDEVMVLEINPRPSASMALYGDRAVGPFQHGLVRAHAQAFGTRAPWDEIEAAHTGQAALTVKGELIVFAPRALYIDHAAAQTLAEWAEWADWADWPDWPDWADGPGCHDLPCAGTDVERGAPLCSVSASGTSAVEVKRRLHACQQALWQALSSQHLVAPLKATA